MQSEPYDLSFKRRWYVEWQENCFNKMNKFVNKAASKVIDTITYWSKGRIKRSKTNRIKRSTSNKTRRFIKTKFNKSKRKQQLHTSKNLQKQSLRIKHKIFSRKHNNKLSTLYVLPQQITKAKPRQVYFESETAKAGIDNRCTASISNNPSDFVGKLTPVTVNLVSYKGEEQTEMMKGTLLWKWKDDNDILHSFKIPNSFYDPNGSRFLSPQHWARELKRSGKYDKSSVFYKGDDDTIILCWNNNTATCNYKRDRVADIILHVNQTEVQELQNQRLTSIHSKFNNVSRKRSK